MPKLEPLSPWDRNIGKETLKFTEWWKGDKERAKCTLEQALGSYCSSFPGRLLPLLVELLEFVR